MKFTDQWKTFFSVKLNELVLNLNICIILITSYNIVFKRYSLKLQQCRIYYLAQFYLRRVEDI
jgi:hypothetical protein